MGDALCDKPLNVNRISMNDLFKYDALILGTPSYGMGEIPGASAGCIEPNWEEFFARVTDVPDFSGKKIALFALGAQERYAERMDQWLSQVLPRLTNE